MKDRNEASVENTTASELLLARSLMIEAERTAGRAERIRVLTLTATMVAAVATIVAYQGLGPDNAAGAAAAGATAVLGIAQLGMGRNADRRHANAQEAADMAREISRADSTPTQAQIETWRTRRLQLEAKMGTSAKAS